MALTESNMMALGEVMPEFSLVGSDGAQYPSTAFDQPILVVIFICNHCPYVIHIAPALSKLADDYADRGVQFVAINSNDTQAYPADAFELMEPEREKRGYRFPYLFDESQAVAKAFDAACTPDLYVFDKTRKLVYRGQFDDTRPTRIASGHYDSSGSPATGESLKHVLETLVVGGEVDAKQYPSMGCNIKWQA